MRSSALRVGFAVGMADAASARVHSESSEPPCQISLALPSRIRWRVRWTACWRVSTAAAPKRRAITRRGPALSGRHRRRAALPVPSRGPTRSRVGTSSRCGPGCFSASLGGMITQWPYVHACGLPLLEYFGAVTMVIVAGAWIAVASWSRRHAPSHVLALLLILWGIAVAAYEILPRVGYAAQRWTWQC